MITCTCIEKFRNKNGNIKLYRLQDNKGQCIDIKSDQLKLAIFSKQINVVNLKLTSDGRLIDRSEHEIADEVMLQAEQKIVDLINLRLLGGRESMSITDKDNLKLAKLFGETYGLPIEVLKFHSGDGCNDLVFGCGTQKLIITNSKFGLAYHRKYGACLKIKGKYTEVFNTDTSIHGDTILFDSSQTLNHVEIGHVRNLVSILKENITKVSYCGLMETIMNTVRNKDKQIRGTKLNFEILEDEIKDTIQLYYDGTLKVDGQNMKTPDGRAVFIDMCLLDLVYNYNTNCNKYELKLSVASSVFDENNSNTNIVVYTDNDFIEKKIYIDANKPLDTKEIEKIIDDSIKYNRDNVARLVKDEVYPN